MVIYAGHSSNVVKRIRTNHCSGNVEASVLRLRIAQEKGYNIVSTRRPSDSVRKRIDLPDPSEGEAEVSRYIRSGRWKYVLCDSDEEARDFEWYVIEHVRPLLNVEGRQWREPNTTRYQVLLEELQRSEGLSCQELRGKPTGPGVYVLHHDLRP